jgi:hypothetical protein
MSSIDGNHGAITVGDRGEVAGAHDVLPRSGGDAAVDAARDDRVDVGIDRAV